MENKLKKLNKTGHYISLVLMLNLISCSANTNVNTNQDSLIQPQSINKNVSISNDGVYKVNVGKGKATFSSKIKFSDFKTKSISSNVSGSPAKTASDIVSYQVYLIKNAASSGYPTNGDPLGDIVFGPVTVINNGATTKQINFLNVGTSGTDFYYIAVIRLGIA